MANAVVIIIWIPQDLSDDGLYGVGNNEGPDFFGYNQNDFLLWKKHRVGQAMASNHINSDLQNALRQNGVGYDKVWDCIGDVVADAQDSQTNWFEDMGAWTVRHIGPDQLDVQKIRDQMRERVRREAGRRR